MAPSSTIRSFAYNKGQIQIKVCIRGPEVENDTRWSSLDAAVLPWRYDALLMIIDKYLTTSTSQRYIWKCYYHCNMNNNSSDPLDKKVQNSVQRCFWCICYFYHFHVVHPNQRKYVIQSKQKALLSHMWFAMSLSGTWSAESRWMKTVAAVLSNTYWNNWSVFGSQGPHCRSSNRWGFLFVSTLLIKVLGIRTP